MMAFRLNKKENKKWGKFSRRKSTCTMNPLQFSNHASLLLLYWYRWNLLRAKLACEFFMKMSKNVYEWKYNERDSWGLHFYIRNHDVQNAFTVKFNDLLAFCFPKNEKKSFIPSFIHWIMLENVGKVRSWTQNKWFPYKWGECQ